MRLNLEDANVEEWEVSVKQVRDWFNGGGDHEKFQEELEVKLDTAQGPVFDESYKAYYLVIKIVP